MQVKCWLCSKLIYVNGYSPATLKVKYQDERIVDEPVHSICRDEWIHLRQEGFSTRVAKNTIKRIFGGDP